MEYEGYTLCHTYAVAGLPTVSVPVTVEDGLPVGVQVVARAFAEHMALAGASVVERAHGGFNVIANRQPTIGGHLSATETSTPAASALRGIPLAERTIRALPTRQADAPGGAPLLRVGDVARSFRGIADAAACC